MKAWDEFYFNVLSQLAYQSNSGDRRQGALLVKNNSVISGACYDAYEVKEEEKIVGSGAIESAICYCAKNGCSTNGATLYTYSFPNNIVCKLLIKAGINEIKFVKPNDSNLGRELCEKAGIKIYSYQRETPKTT